MKYKAILNVAYPRWQDEVIGTFDQWNDARNAVIKALDETYPGKWWANFEDKGHVSQYSPTDEFWEKGNHCLALIDVEFDEQEQLEKDIARLSAELKQKQDRLAMLRMTGRQI
jgi:hypothetical protein